MFEAAITALQVQLDTPVTEPDARRGLAELARVRSLVDAVDAHLAAVVAERGDAAAAIRGTTRCSQREADRRADRAQTVGEVPGLGDALASGRTTAEHVDVLKRAVDATSGAAVASSDLLRKAETKPPDLFARDVRSFVRKHENAAAAEERRRRQRARRSCSVFEGDNGMWILHAELDSTSGAEVQSALDRASNALFHSDGGRGASADRRTPTQRRADALVAMLAGEPVEAGAGPPAVRNQMVLVVTADGGWIPATGERLSPSEVERLACGSDLVGLVLSADGDPLWHGRRRRLASDGQWRALIVRDGGCVICNVRPAMCEAHHVVHWDPPPRGPTGIDNLALLCRHHHHELHERGQQLWRTADGWEMRAPP